jgi:hypothetical protein
MAIMDDLSAQIKTAKGPHESALTLNRPRCKAVPIDCVSIYYPSEKTFQFCPNTR